MRRFIAIAIAAAALAGCAANVKPLTTPDGKQGFMVACNGSINDWSSCYADAMKACGGKPYNVIDRNESSAATQYGLVVRRNLIAECR